MKLYIPLAVLFVLMSASCEKSTTYSSEDLIVLEGYLFQNEKVDSIHLTRTLFFTSDDTIYSPVDDAIITLGCNDQQYLLDNIGNGYYDYSGDDLLIEEGNEYTIEIDVNGQIIYSSTIVPNKTSIYSLTENIVYVDTVITFGPGQFMNAEEDGLEITWENPDNSYYYVVIESADSTATDIIMGNDDFSHPFMGDRPFEVFRFRSEPFIGDHYRINPRMLEKYGEHKVKIYSVNEEYANLYENREQDSRSLAEPITNVINGLGIFTAFSYDEVRFYVKNLYRH